MVLINFEFWRSRASLVDEGFTDLKINTKIARLEHLDDSCIQTEGGPDLRTL